MVREFDAEHIAEEIDKIPDEVLSRITFAMPWQTGEGEVTRRDPDGFTDVSLLAGEEDFPSTRKILQAECWSKFQRNPQVNTSVRGLTGRLVGFGFRCTSPIQKIADAIYEVENDIRNRLYIYWPKYIARHYIEGELFLLLTVHPDGFFEVDFIPPSSISQGGTDDTGILFHPKKHNFPLFYNVDTTGSLLNTYEQIPSITVAYYPEPLIAVAKGVNSFNRKYQEGSRSRKRAYQNLGGYTRFIVAWDKGFMTKRAVSYLRTTLIWLNHYENLKKYEIDHKKSSGAYVWTFAFEDITKFRQWLKLTDEERRKTGITQKIIPGQRLILPPGMSCTAVSPKLSQITDEDKDILQMATSGLNEPLDITTGTPSGSYASASATRGPMSDRVADEVAYFERFLRYDFWKSIFFLKNKVGSLPDTFKVKRAVDFDENLKPIMKNVKVKPEDLIEFDFPVSETVNYEGRVKAFMGTKHGPLAETLGVSKASIARKLGIGTYKTNRLEKATEDVTLPELVYEVDQEQVQEIEENNPTEKN